MDRSFFRIVLLNDESFWYCFVVSSISRVQPPGWYGKQRNQASERREGEHFFLIKEIFNIHVWIEQWIPEHAQVNLVENQIFERLL